MSEIYNALFPPNYSVLIHCMDYDWQWISARFILCAMIAGLYLYVAVSAYNAYVHLKHKTELATISMIQAVVWVLCGLDGYVLDVIGAFVPIGRVKVVCLIPHVVITAVFCLQIHRRKYMVRTMLLEQELQKEKDKWITANS